MQYDLWMSLFVTLLFGFLNVFSWQSSDLCEFVCGFQHFEGYTASVSSVVCRSNCKCVNTGPNVEYKYL
jgi:hypothetical protein